MGQANRVPVLDGFRGYAILGVVTIHLLLVSRVVTQHADVLAWGVLGNVIDTFFIISGFVIFLPVARRGELGSVRDFALGRVARIAPGYWLSIAVVVFLVAVAPPAGAESPLHRIPELLGDLAALQMPIRLFDATFPLGMGVNGALWMISVIVGFYVVFPFIARPYARHPLVGLALAAIITLGWKELVLHAPGLFAWLDHSGEPSWVNQLIATDQLPGWFFSFALGMTGAWAYVRLERAKAVHSFQRPALVAVAVSLAACGVCAYLYGERASDAAVAVLAGGSAREEIGLTMIYSVARAALMGSIILAPLWVQRPFANPVARTFAELGYGIYLIHVVVVTYVGLRWLGLPTDGSLGAALLWFGVVIPTSMVYAELSRRFVELPAKGWILSWRNRGQEARATAPPRLRHSDA
jgi:peptidoglycan/LPS O-acetylase OafA/YrhL